MNQKAMYPVMCVTAVAAMFTIGAPLCASETDDRIESSFKKTYVYRTYLKDDAVAAEAKDGVVTLTGTVADESHRALAQDTAAGLPGVTSVDNQLTTAAEAAAESADTWIGRKLKLALLFHRNVSYSAIKTGVTTRDGKVALTGIAKNAAEKALVTKLVTDIKGVTSVDNQMTIKHI